MRNQLSFRVTLLAVLILGLGIGSPTAQAAMKAKKLKPLKKHSWSFGKAIGNSGDVVGYSQTDGCDETAVVWRQGKKPKRLKPPAGGEWAQVLGINQEGMAVGVSYTRENCAPFNPAALECHGQSPVAWDSSGKPKVLKLPAKFGTLGRARDINVLGEVAGNAYDPETCASVPVYWDTVGKARKLKDLPAEGYPEAWAKAIRTDLKTPFLAAGNAHGALGYRAVVWKASGKAKALELLSGDRESAVSDMNREGTVVGTSFNSSRPQAVRWNPQGKAERLPPPAGAEDNCEAGGINDSGFIVGVCVAQLIPQYYSWVPVVWEPDGTAHALPFPGWSEDCTAEKINDEGLITGACFTALPPGGGTVGVVWK
jgi:hypothetical protein